MASVQRLKQIDTLKNHVLSMVAQGEPLKHVLHEMCLAAEKVNEEGILRSTILFLDEEDRLREGAGPSMPDYYNNAIDGLKIGDGVGSCGTAAYRKQICIVEDIDTHPNWNKFTGLTKKVGVHACWSMPIIAQNGSCLGTFAMYYTRAMSPDQDDIDFIQSMGKLAGIAIETLRAKEALESSRKNLEHLVADRTAEVKGMFKSVPLGIFSLVDTKGTISEEHSDFLREILEAKSIAGRTLPEVLLRECTLSNDELDAIQTAIASIVGESEMSWESNAHLLPKHLRFQSPSGKTKLLSVQWRPIVNEEGDVWKLLGVISDETDKVTLKAQADEQSIHLLIINELTTLNPDKYSDFRNAFNRTMEDARKKISRAGKKDDELVKNLYINLHTIKGLARTFGLSRLSTALHTAEREYASMREDHYHNWNQEKLLNDLVYVEEVFRQYDSINTEKLGRKNTSDYVYLPKSELRARYEEISSLDGSLLSPEDKAKVSRTKEVFQKIFYRQSRDVLSDVLYNKEQLSKDLGKSIPVVDINDPGILLVDEAQNVLKNVLIHIFRNSMDHGIEPDAERIQNNKKPEGLITIRMEKMGSELRILYFDDGRGLNLKKLESIGVEKGLTKKGCSDEEIANTVFVNGISTADKLTEISGRGVGMDAVKSYLATLGGTARFIFMGPRTPEGFRPFAIEMFIPAKYCEMSHSHSKSA